jgi:hypothetical protein
MELAAEVNTYRGPSGQGYEIVGTIVLAGRTWRKIINVGPETYRDRDWE